MSTQPTSITVRIAAVAGALALLFAACGDSGSPTSTAAPDATEATTTTSTTDATPTETSAPSETSAPRSTTTSAPRRTTTTTSGDGGSTTTTAAAPATTAPDDALAAALAVREAPLAIEQDDGTVITFSEWFFATFNRDATVTVERGGQVLAEGTVVDTTVMEDRGADGFAFFGSNGNVVATLSQMELLDAANQALIDAGLAP